MKQPNTNGRGRVGVLSRDDDARAAELYDLAFERQVLFSCMMHPDLVLASGIAESDFYSGANGRIWNAILHLVADGVQPDTVNVRSFLHDAGTLAAVGGDDYLLAITDGIPYEGIDTKRLRRLARRRRLQEAAQLVARSAGTEHFAQAMAAYDSAKLELEAIETATFNVPTLAECALALGAAGTRLATGLPTLDTSTRGGLPLGRFVALLGAPGASKTNLTAWWADQWEREGAAVVFVAADEAREAIVMRLAQLDGLDRDTLEGEDPAHRERFARQARARRILVVDPSDDRVMLEDAERVLIELAGDRPRVMFIDSLQTTPCASAALLETARERIEAAVDVIKGICKRGTLVVGISEMSRAAYRSSKQAENISALGAGAESRAIEYAAHLLIGLRPVAGETGVVDLEVAKNRLHHAKPEIRATLDFATLRWREIGKPVEDEAQREIKRANEVRERVLEAVRKSECKSINALVRVVGIRKRDTAAMVRELEQEGLLQRVAGVYRVANMGGNGA